MNVLKNLFSIRRIDNHIICLILGVQIKIKYKTDFVCPIVESKGTTDKKRDTKIIASLTTFPARIDSVYKTISTLLTQTQKPDEVILWLAESQFPERKLPENLTNLEQYGLTINWCEDIRSYKKLIPTLKKYPNDIVITFDDDIYYMPDTIESLYNSYLKYPKDIHSHRCGLVYVKNKQIKDVSMRKLYFKDFNNASFDIRLIGYGGVLYPPHSLYKDVLDEKFIREVPTHDDIWFWAMALLNMTKIRSVKGYTESVNYVENTQDVGLCKINKGTSQGGSVEDAIAKMVKMYPELLALIEGCSGKGR